MHKGTRPQRPQVSGDRAWARSGQAEELASEPHPDLESEPRTPSLTESASQAILYTQLAPPAHIPGLARTGESSLRPQAPTGPRPPGQAHLARGVGGSAARPPPPRLASPGSPAREERLLQRSAPTAAPRATTRAGAGGGEYPPPPLPGAASRLPSHPSRGPCAERTRLAMRPPPRPHPTANFPIGRETRPATRTDWMDVQRLQFAVGLLVLSVLAEDRPPSGAGRDPDTCPECCGYSGDRRFGAAPSRPPSEDFPG